jgi:nucleoside-diphosphate-sugar epimerase
MFWHCAGDTRFDPRLRNKIHCTNLTGTANAIATAELLGIENFCHVSTAFLFGDYVGVGAEVPHPNVGQTFNNPYEESKFMAEQLVTASTLNWIIFRPPIVVGDARDGSINGFSGYYGFMREFWRFRDAVLNDINGESQFLQQAGIKMCGNLLYLPIDVPGREHSILTIASVDFVIDAMVELVHLPSCWREVYHLVPPQSRTYGWWLDTSLKVLGIEGVRVVEPNKLIIDRSRGRYQAIVQRRIVQGCKSYIPYIAGATTFEPSNLARVLPLRKHESINEQFVSLLLKYAILQRFGEA